MALESADIKFMLHGLIARDCDGPTGPPTPEQEAQAKAHREACERGDLVFLTLSSPGTIKYVEVDRAAARKLIEDGWRLDEKTTAWANKETRHGR